MLIVNRLKTSRPAQVVLAVGVALVLVVSCLATSFFAKADDSSLPTHIVNGDFEYPALKWGDDAVYESDTTLPNYAYINPSDGKLYWVNWDNNGNDSSSVSGFDFSKFGWKSTTIANNAEGIGLGIAGLVEFQHQEDGNGGQYAEIASDTVDAAEEDGGKGHGAIYQDIATTPNAVYKWSLKHASLNYRHIDTMSVLIGPKGKLEAQKATRTSVNGHGDELGLVGTVFGTKVSNGEDQEEEGAGNSTYNREHDGQWETYTGTYLVPEGQEVTRFTFQNISAQNDTQGNLVDDISFEIAYALNYDFNGGNGTKYDPTANNYAGYHVAGENVALDDVADPTYPGHTFLGWSLEKLDPSTDKASYDSNKSKCITNISSFPDDHTTVYAVWAVNPTVTFYDGYSKNIKLVELSPGGSTTAPDDPTRDYYTFNGWDKASSAWTNVYEDTVITATWVPTPTVTFVNDCTGETLKKVQVKKKCDAVTPPDDPVCDGKIFVDWDSDAYKSVCTDTIITPVWKKVCSGIPEILKVDADNSTSQGSASLVGAVFSVTYYDGTYTSKASLPASGTDFGTVKTYLNADGDVVINTSGITVGLGTIVLREVEAPEGYLLTDEMRIGTLSGDAAGNVTCVWHSADGTELSSETYQGVNCDSEGDDMVLRTLTSCDTCEA